MSTLDTLRSERDVLEERGDYESGAYVWLVERIAELEAAEPATPSVPAPESTPTSSSPIDRIAALERDMREATLHPERLSDEQRHSLLSRLNSEVRVALDEGSEPEPEPEDVTALAAQMRAAAAQGNGLDPVQATELAARFGRAVRHQVDHAAPVEELRGLVAGNDLETRYAAAAELARRGLLPEDVAAQMVDQLNAAVREADAAGPLAGAEIPEHLRELAADMLAQAERDAQRPQDPHDALVSRYNAAMRQAAEQARERDLITAPTGAPSEPEGSPTQEA